MRLSEPCILGLSHLLDSAIHSECSELVRPWRGADGPQHGFEGGYQKGTSPFLAFLCQHLTGSRGLGAETLAGLLWVCWESRCSLQHMGGEDTVEVLLASTVLSLSFLLECTGLGFGGLGVASFHVFGLPCITEKSLHVFSIALTRDVYGCKHKCVLHIRGA